MGRHCNDARKWAPSARMSPPGSPSSSGSKSSITKLGKRRYHSEFWLARRRGTPFSWKGRGPGCLSAGAMDRKRISRCTALSWEIFRACSQRQRGSIRGWGSTYLFALRAACCFGVRICARPMEFRGGPCSCRRLGLKGTRRQAARRENRSANDAAHNGNHAKDVRHRLDRSSALRHRGSIRPRMAVADCVEHLVSHGEIARIRLGKRSTLERS